jgi:hypothetical protein
MSKSCALNLHPILSQTSQLPKLVEASICFVMILMDTDHGREIIRRIQEMVVEVAKSAS